MRSGLRLWLACLALIALGLTATRAAAQDQTCPGAEGIPSLKCLLAEGHGQPLHIVFIHGIRTDARGASFALQTEIWKKVYGGDPRMQILRWSSALDIGDKPDASFLGHQIWNNPEEWKQSQPFVDHYIYPPTANGGRIIVDEVNWWPLVFPLKCRLLLGGETNLVGPDARTIQLCGDVKGGAGHLHPLSTDHYTWLTQPIVVDLLNRQPPLGSTAAANVLLKQEIMDWGLSDAVVSLGPMKYKLRGAVQCALENIASAGVIDDAGAKASETAGGATSTTSTQTLTPDRLTSHLPPPNSWTVPFVCKRGGGPAQPHFNDANFILVSHSLGSFLLLDTFASTAQNLNSAGERTKPSYNAAADAQASVGRCASEGLGADAVSAQQDKIAGLCFVIQNSKHLYFLANQFPLLELGRVEGVYATDKPSPNYRAGGTQAAAAEVQTFDAMRLWACAVAQPTTGGCTTTKQLVAFSDRNDILTFDVPCIHNVQVFNIRVHNAWNILKLFANPATAHVGYFTNNDVLSTIVDGAGAAGAASSAAVDMIPPAPNAPGAPAYGAACPA
jgi:hypothetical protein